MSQKTIGWLGADANVAGLAAAFCYFYFARRAPLRISLLVAVVTSALSSFLYVFYNTPHAAFVIDFQGGFFGRFAEAVFLDLAARATPAGCEGLGYSFMMSVLNLSVTGSDWLGSHIADQYHIKWNSMVYLNGGTTLIVLLLLPFMPRAMMASRDNQTPNTEDSGEPEAA
jgi:MFS family permease